MTEAEGKILADIRNKFGSIYSFFQLEELIQIDEEKYGEGTGLAESMKDLQKDLQKDLIPNCIESMKIIKKQLDKLE